MLVVRREFILPATAHLLFIVCSVASLFKSMASVATTVPHPHTEWHHHDRQPSLFPRDPEGYGGDR